jgi:hypothetical protein
LATAIGTGTSALTTLVATDEARVVVATLHAARIAALAFQEVATNAIAGGLDLGAGMRPAETKA